MSAHTPSIRLYGFYPYDRSAKPRWLLTELGVEFKDRWLDRENQEHEGPEYLQLNPMGRAPVLKIDDTVIFESGAICAFLADRFADRGLAPALGTPLRAKYEQWLFFAAATIDPFLGRIMIIEDIPAGELRTKKETELLLDVRNAMHTLDLAIAKGPFLLGERFSAADACVGYQTYWCTLWPEFDAIIHSFPNVVAYLARLKQMPSAVKAQVFTYPG